MAGSINDITADSRTIPTTGYDRIKIKFPAVTSRTTHTFTLTGSDLNSTLVPNVNPISIVQDGEVTLTVKPSITSYLGQTNYSSSGTPFTFDQNTSAPPGAAKVKFNSGSIATYGAGSVTEIYIDKGTDSFWIKNDFKVNFLRQSSENMKHFKTIKNKVYFDLRGYIFKQLKNTGIQNIEIIKKDTFNPKNNFFSARRSLKKKINDYGRNISIIMIK